MAFCDHCQGQRYDRARVLRELRQLRREFARARTRDRAEATLAAAIEAIRVLEIPHLDPPEIDEGTVIH